MSIRTRLARWLDPNPPEPVLPFSLWRYDSETSATLKRIAETLEHMDRDTHQRRQRVIQCRHPELHPELDPEFVASLKSE